MKTAIGCAKCGNLVTCTCKLAVKHKPKCRYFRAAQLGIELACEHGLQACPKCDPCSCGAGETKGVR